MYSFVALPLGTAPCAHRLSSGRVKGRQKTKQSSTHNSNSLEAVGQPDLPIEFQASQGYTGLPCLNSPTHNKRSIKYVHNPSTGEADAGRWLSSRLACLHSENLFQENNRLLKPERTEFEEGC